MIEIAVDGINCPKCATKYECLMLEEAHVIWVNEDWTGGILDEIIVDESPFLQAQFGKHINAIPIRIKKDPNIDHSSYNYKTSCPLCGEFTVEYKGVPKDVDVYVGADRG